MGNMLESESSESEKDDNNSENETRTEADGMESTFQDNPTSSSAQANTEKIIQPSLDSIGPLRRLNSESSVTSKPVEPIMNDNKNWCSTKASTIATKQSPKQLPPRENLIVLKPKSAKSLENNNSNTFNKIVPNSNKQKEPKFVPYEPYKGAVRSMTENSVKTHSRKPSCESSTASIASGSSSTQLNMMVVNSNKDNSSSSTAANTNKPADNSTIMNLNTRKSFSNRPEDVTASLSSIYHQNIDRSTNNSNLNTNSYNNNLDLELSASSLLVLKERLKINEKDINELQVENTRLKRMLVDSMSGFGSPPKPTSEMSHHHTPKCQLNPAGCSSMSESVDNLTDEIEVWRSKFLSTCVLVEQVTKQNQDWKKGIISAAALFRELKQRSEVLTPDLFDKINSWLANNNINNNNNNSVRHTDNSDSAHSRSSSITYAHDMSTNDESHPSHLS